MRALSRGGMGRSQWGWKVLQKAERSLPPSALGDEFAGTWAAIAQRYVLLADLFGQQGQNERAANCLEHYIRLNPRAPDRESIERIIERWKS